MCPARVNMHFKALAAACIIICFHGTSHAVDEVMFLIRVPCAKDARSLGDVCRGSKLVFVAGSYSCPSWPRSPAGCCRLDACGGASSRLRLPAHWLSHRQDSCTWRWSCPRGGGTGPNPPKSHGLCNIYKQHDMDTSQIHMDSATSTRWIARIPQEYTWVVRPHRVCDLCPYRKSYRFCDPYSTDTRKELTWVLQPLQTALRSYLKRSHGFCNSKVSRSQGKKENARIWQERQ